MQCTNIQTVTNKCICAVPSKGRYNNSIKTMHWTAALKTSASQQVPRQVIVPGLAFPCLGYSAQLHPELAEGPFSCFNMFPWPFGHSAIAYAETCFCLSQAPQPQFECFSSLSVLQLTFNRKVQEMRQV
jgi:hypothetical protein